MNIAWRIYQRLARAFPHEFKLAYGREVMQLGEGVVQDIAKRDGAAGLFRLIADIAIRVPLDALRTLEAEGVIGAGKLYPAYYVIPGNQGSPTVMRRIGQEIAADLKKDNVEGVLFVAT